MPGAKIEIPGYVDIPMKRTVSAFALAVLVVSSLVSLASPAFAQPVLVTTGIVSPFSSKCVDLASGSTADGALAIIFGCNNNGSQQFKLRPYNGAFQVVAGHSGKCLVVSGASMNNGALVVQAACNGATSGLWTTRTSGSGFQLVASHSGRCMEVQNSNTASGTRIVQGGCSGASNEVFTFPAPVSNLILTAQHSGKCLSVSNGATAEGTQITQFQCQGLASQAWRLSPYGGSFRVIAQHSGKCISIQGGSRANLANAVQTSCTGVNWELFDLRPSGSNYSLVARHSGRCLDVHSGLTADGTPIIQYDCFNPPNQIWSAAPAGAISPGGSLGLWSSVINLPIVPVAAANLPNGQLLVWSAYDRMYFGGDNQQTYTALFNPSTNTATERLVTETGHDMFCPGTSNLPDGSVLVNGGSSSSKTSIYNPVTNTWQASQVMSIPRGYQANTVLSNGEVFTLGGSWSGGLDNKDGEVWNASTGWRMVANADSAAIVGPDPQGVYRSDNHAWLFATANEGVFHAGPSARMNQFTTAGAGTVTNAGNRADDAYSMNGNAVMFDIGKILKTGGAPAYQDADATTKAYVIDINNGVSVQATNPMGNARAFHSSVALPNGEVLLVGGQSHAIPFTDATAVLAAEMFSPVTNRFSALATMSVPRTYHSVAILLPDARVFVGGGGLCGTCSTNHPDAQIFTPPYLLDANNNPRPRPAITSAPSTATWGSNISVTTGSGVAAFVLMRLSSITHTVNNDQRRIPVSFSAAGTNTYSVSVPTSRGVVLPGYYMLFALDSVGVPSVSRTLRIQ